MKEFSQKLLTFINKLFGGGLLGVCFGEDWPVCFANGNLLKVLGYSEEELLGLNQEHLIGIIHPEDKEEFFRIIRRETDEQLQTVKFRMKKKDGSFLWMLSLGLIPALDGGKKVLILGNTDVDAAKLQYEHAKKMAVNLALKDQELSLLYDSIPGGFCKVRLDDYFTLIQGNHLFYEIYGYSPEEMQIKFGNRLSATIFPGDSEKIINKTHQAWERHEKGFEFEQKIVRKDGALIWLLTKGTFVPDDQGVIMDCVLMDITYRKSIEQALQLQEERFRLALKQVVDVVFDYDIIKHTISYSDHGLNTFDLGVRAGNIPEDIIKNGMVHGNDGEIFLHMYKKVTEGEPEADCTVRLKSEKGKYRWKHIALKTIYNISGQPIRAVGIVQDMTQQKQLEEAVMEEELYRKVMMSNVILYGKINLTKNQVESINESQVDTIGQLNGRQYSEFVARMADLLVCPQEREKVLKSLSPEALIAYFDSGKTEFRCGHWQSNGDGQTFWMVTVVHMKQDPLSDELKGVIYTKHTTQSKTEKVTGINELIYGRPSLNLSKEEKNTLLDYLDDVLYISDPETYEILYINRPFAKRLGYAPEDYVGQKCYSLLQGMDQPCPFCTNKYLSFDESYVWEHTNKRENRRYLIKDKLILWNGRAARLEYAMDISNKSMISRDLMEKLEAGELQLECIRKMFEASSLEKSLKSVLERVGEFYKADRTFYMEYCKDSPVSSFLIEWDNVGSRPRQDWEKAKEMFSGWLWRKALKRGTNLQIRDVEELRFDDWEEYKRLKQMGICSLLAVPFSDGDISGFVGIDNPEYIHEEDYFLESLSYFISNEMIKRRMLEKFEYMSDHDLLTGLMDRNGYIQSLDKYRKTEIKSMGVLVANINDLKEVNEFYGHGHGDLMICKVSQSIKEVFQEYPVFRISGDEFLVLCKDISQKDFADRVKRMDERFEVMDHQGAAFGHVWNDAYVDTTDLISKAYELMGVAKEKHHLTEKNISGYVQSIRLKELLKSIELRHFIVYLQPKIHLTTGELSGIEALVRYVDEEHGLLTPDHFITGLERYSLIRYVDFFVLEEVCRIMGEWKDKGYPPVRVSLNFSRNTLLEPDVARTAKMIADKYGIDTRMLEIEVTESYGDMDRLTLTEISGGFKKEGFNISLDDFGTEYSNITLLSSYDFDTVKLDRSLVKNLTENHKARIIVQCAIEMCHKLGFEIIAEGVETEEQQDILREMGCDVIQGYFYGRPMPVEAFEKGFLKA